MDGICHHCCFAHRFAHFAIRMFFSLMPPLCANIILHNSGISALYHSSEREESGGWYFTFGWKNEVYSRGDFR